MHHTRLKAAGLTAAILALCALILYLWTLRVYLRQLERVVMTWEKQLEQERRFVTEYSR